MLSFANIILTRIERIFSLRLPLFLIACGLGTSFAIFWYHIGETWKILGDGIYYLALYQGKSAPAPFGYRLMAPYLARLLPWDFMLSFEAITLGCLILTTGIIALYGARSGFSHVQILTLCAFWGTSFAFAYYSTTIVRADGPMLLILSIVFLLSQYRAPSTVLLALISLGILSHETILICIPALFLDKMLSGNLTGGRKYRYWQLGLIAMGALLFFIATRKLIPTVHLNSMNYASAPFAMFKYVLDYSGGIIKHFLRIYASYGPALIFAFAYAATQTSTANKLSFAMLFIIAAGATFFATDTLRVMAIIYFPVIVYATCYLKYLWHSAQYKKAVFCSALQVFYSFIVYGHLRTFESSLALNAIAAVLSLLAVAVCISALGNEFVGACSIRMKKLLAKDPHGLNTDEKRKFE